MWLQHPDCKDFIKHSWSERISGCPMLVLQKKLQTLKTWNKHIFGNLHVFVFEKLKLLDSIQLQLESTPLFDKDSLQRETCDVLCIVNPFSGKRKLK